MNSLQPLIPAPIQSNSSTHTEGSIAITQLIQYPGGNKGIIDRGIDEFDDVSISCLIKHDIADLELCRESMRATLLPALEKQSTTVAQMSTSNQTTSWNKTVPGHIRSF